MRSPSPLRPSGWVIRPSLKVSFRPERVARSGGICCSPGAATGFGRRSRFLHSASHGKAVRGFGRNDTFMRSSSNRTRQRMSWMTFLKAVSTYSSEEQSGKQCHLDQSSVISSKEVSFRPEQDGFFVLRSGETPAFRGCRPDRSPRRGGLAVRANMVAPDSETVCFS